jgi:serine/threonine protein kinase
MMELLNKLPRNFSTIGTHSKKYVDIMGNLRKIPKLNFLSLKDLLIKKYRALPSESQGLSDFLMPMLKVYPQDRISAFEALEKNWLNVESQNMFEDSERIDVPDFPSHFNGNQVEAEFLRVVDEEDFDADKSFASGDFGEDDGDEPGQIPDFYEKECKYFDRSFKNVYVGYADGIDLNALDNTANWQFDQKSH